MTDPTHIEQFFPFYRIGLHRNPFGTLSEQEWYAVTIPPPEVQAALDSGFEHLMVLGRKGRGKSTTLNYLRYHFRLQGQRTTYERLPRWKWTYTTDLSGLDVFAFDEMQRLAPWEIVRLFRERAQYGTRLLIGSHRNHAPEFALAGVPVTVIKLDGRLTQARLAQILQRRIDVFTRDGGTQITFSPDAVAALHRRYRDDLRGIEWFLYDYFQTLPDALQIIAADLNL